VRCTVVSRTRRNFELNFDHHNYNLYFILLPRAVQRTFKVLYHISYLYKMGIYFREDIRDTSYVYAYGFIRVFFCEFCVGLCL
jgi:hypothetical protein